MTRKTVKHSIFSTISSDHASVETLPILAVDMASGRSLFVGSSYVEVGPAASFSHCSLVAGRRSK